MNENLLVGLQMMGIGLGFVICFLCVTILGMIVMSRIVGYLNKVFPETVTEVKKVAKTVTSDDSAIAIVIAAVMAKVNKA